MLLKIAQICFNEPDHVTLHCYEHNDKNDTKMTHKMPQ